MFFLLFFPILPEHSYGCVSDGGNHLRAELCSVFAEIYRGGIKSIDAGQYEAAHSLGLSRSQTLFGIILPQTFRIVIPPISNEIIVLVKDTALASAIALADIMKVSKSIVNRDGSLMAYVIAAAMYLVFSFLVTCLLERLEKKTSLYDGKEA